MHLPPFTRARSGSKVHGGTAAAPMIAMILKDVYKLDANGNKRKRTEPGEDRGSDGRERVEEDESRLGVRPLRLARRSSIVPLNFGSSASTPKLSA